MIYKIVDAAEAEESPAVPVILRGTGQMRTWNASAMTIIGGDKQADISAKLVTIIERRAGMVEVVSTYPPRERKPGVRTTFRFVADKTGDYIETSSEEMRTGA